MKSIFKVLLTFTLCSVSMACSDDEELDDGYVCYECIYDNPQYNIHEIIPVCGENTYVDIMVKNYESQGMVCTRKK